MPRTNRSSILFPVRAFFLRLLVLGLVAFGGALPAQAWGRKVNLVRKYRPGQKMVYQTTIQTHASVQSEPPGLKAFLPPIPTELETRQKNTVTIKEVQPDGAAVIQNRFDEFDFKSNLAELLPENLRDSAMETQRDFTKGVTGQVLTARYDRNGKLLGFDGADDMLAEVEGPLREPLRQLLRLFLEQMGGHALFPGRPVKRGEEWRQRMDEPAREDYPFAVQGESVLHYSGKTKFRGVKAAQVDFTFTNVMTPEIKKLPKSGPLSQLNASGLDLEMHVHGEGKGRVLLALDDGRVLQNHASIHETLNAQLKSARGLPITINKPVRLEIQSQTELAVEGAGK